MATLDIQNIRDELCQFLRSKDILTTSVRGVTRTSGSYTVGAGGESSRTFTGNTPTRNFYILTVNGVAKYFLRDYTMNWNTGTLTWNTPLVNGDDVVYQIDWGTGDKIYPDLPRDDLTHTSFPRIGIELTSISTEPFSLGGSDHISDLLITVYVWVSANKDSNVAGGFGGLNDLSDTMTSIRDEIRGFAKQFYTFPWITPTGTAPLMRGKDNKILQQSQDFRIRFLVE